METALILRNRVKELRSRLRLRQVDLAREVDVTRQTIIAIEKSRLNPSITVCLKIARILREPTDYVFYLDHTPARQPEQEPLRDKARPLGIGEEPQSVFDFD